MGVRVGTSGWSYPGWVGPFYPPGTKPARMLAVYAESFGAVEAHNTHRRRPVATTLAKWRADSPDGFRFVPKAHVGISHRRDTDGLAERVAEFADALAPLGDRLGPVLVVLPHRQPDLARLDLLLHAFAGAPTLSPVFELAPPWRVPAVLERFSEPGRNASIAVVDRDDDPATNQPFVGTVAYARLRRSSYTGADLDAWAERLAAVRSHDDAYAFVKHDEEGDGPRYARDLVRRLG